MEVIKDLNQPLVGLVYEHFKALHEQNQIQMIWMGCANLMIVKAVRWILVFPVTCWFWL